MFRSLKSISKVTSAADLVLASACFTIGRRWSFELIALNVGWVIDGFPLLV